MPSPKLVLALLVATTAAAAARADDVAPKAPEQPASTPAETQAEPVWVADFDEAAAKARAEGKDLLVDFTGSDWCGWCVRLHDEVFAKEAFRGVAKDYVLVSLDFPKAPAVQAKVPNPARNRELQEKYGVEGFPTVLLMTADGDVFGRTGYQQGGAEKYVEHLAALRDTGRAALLEALAIVKTFDAASGPAKHDVAVKAVEKVEKAGDGSSWTARLEPLLRAAAAGDPENAQGVKARALAALFKTGAYDAALFDEARKLDPKNEKGLLERAAFAQMTRVQDDATCRAYVATAKTLLASGNWHDKEQAKFLLANAAFWSQRKLEDPEGAKAFAQELKKRIGPSDGRLQELVTDILGDEEKGGGGGEKDADEE